MAKDKWINMNVELRKGGRNAVKISEADFKKELEHAYKALQMEEGERTLYPFTPGNFAYHCCYNNKKLEKNKDLSTLHHDIWGEKYKFDSENVDCSGGIKTSNKGIAYLQCYAGGDWECPVCFFVYYDGSKLRGYVPLKGNSINRDTKMAFGNESSSPEEDSTEYKFLRKEFGVKTNDELPITPDEVKYNVDACLEDFLTRLDISGSYKDHDYSDFDKKYEEYKAQKKAEREERKKQQEAEANSLNEPAVEEALAESIHAVLGENDDDDFVLIGFPNGNPIPEKFFTLTKDGKILANDKAHTQVGEWGHRTEDEYTHRKTNVYYGGLWYRGECSAESKHEFVQKLHDLIMRRGYAMRDGIVHV
jgi:hypothetical protein